VAERAQASIDSWTARCSSVVAIVTTGSRLSISDTIV
jgi:hypothetical protein